MPTGKPSPVAPPRRNPSRQGGSCCCMTRAGVAAVFEAGQSVSDIRKIAERSARWDLRFVRFAGGRCCCWACGTTTSDMSIVVKVNTGADAWSGRKPKCSWNIVSTGIVICVANAWRARLRTGTTTVTGVATDAGGALPRWGRNRRWTRCDVPIPRRRGNCCRGRANFTGQVRGVVRGISMVARSRVTNVWRFPGVKSGLTRWTAPKPRLQKRQPTPWISGARVCRVGCKTRR